jgi:SP family sugar:H+ symporter-like MFS transporter
MRFFNKSAPEEVHEKGTPNTATPADTPPRTVSPTREEETIAPKGKVPAIAVILGATASIGGFMFGYESGQISGFLAMSDFLERFGETGKFSAIRQGTIVGLLA